jgi:hypothetical protein
MLAIRTHQNWQIFTAELKRDCPQMPLATRRVQTNGETEFTRPASTECLMSNVTIEPKTEVYKQMRLPYAEGASFFA